MDLYEKIVYICKKLNKDVGGCRACPIRNVYPKEILWGCPLSVYAPSDWLSKEELNAAVDKWFEKHPVQTRKSEFLRMFPNCNYVIDHGDFINICPRTMDRTLLYDMKYCAKTDCADCKKQYWSEEVE